MTEVKDDFISLLENESKKSVTKINNYTINNFYNNAYESIEGEISRWLELFTKNLLVVNGILKSGKTTVVFKYLKDHLDNICKKYYLMFIPNDGDTINTFKNSIEPNISLLDKPLLLIFEDNYKFDTIHQELANDFVNNHKIKIIVENRLFSLKKSDQSHRCIKFLTLRPLPKELITTDLINENNAKYLSSINNYFYPFYLNLLNKLTLTKELHEKEMFLLLLKEYSDYFLPFSQETTNYLQKYIIANPSYIDIILLYTLKYIENRPNEDLRTLIDMIIDISKNINHCQKIDVQEKIALCILKYFINNISCDDYKQIRQFNTILFNSYWHNSLIFTDEVKKDARVESLITFYFMKMAIYIDKWSEISKYKIRLNELSQNDAKEYYINAMLLYLQSLYENLNSKSKQEILDFKKEFAEKLILIAKFATDLQKKKFIKLKEYFYLDIDKEFNTVIKS